MTPAPHNHWLNRFAWLTAFATLFLISVGGMVTSKGAGMSVPDWPNSYGYNMFFFPPSQWIGGIFYEHTHRLVASLVGFLTIILALWLYGTKSRAFLRWGGGCLTVLGIVVWVMAPIHWEGSKGQMTLNPGMGIALLVLGAMSVGAGLIWPKCAPAAPWLRRLGIFALVLVIVQGLLGGLRVTLFKDQIGIFHATLAQLFLVLVCAIALFTSLRWKTLQAQAKKLADTFGLRWVMLATTLLILGQLIIGATMRHQHAGLAVPDFPLAYGKLWPDTDEASVAAYNHNRLEVNATHPITAFQIKVHMVHRVMALVIFVAVLMAWRRTRQMLGARDGLSRLALVWFLFISVQAGLGMFTVWSGKSADIATAHVAVGATSLVLGMFLTLTAFKCLTTPALASREAENAFQPVHSGAK